MSGYFSGNATEYRDNSRRPRKSSLFFLTVFIDDHGITLCGEVVIRLVKQIAV